MKGFCFTVLFMTVSVFTVYSQTGIIKEMSGEVVLKRADSSSFVPAQIGSQIEKDTVVSTGFRSTAIIEIGSTVITVRPLTKLSIAGIQRSPGSETLDANLQAGRLRVDVNPPTGARTNTTIRTPSSTASVRGTSFDIDTRNLNVRSGSVNWQDSNGFSVTVTTGFSSRVSDIGDAVDPISIAVTEFSPSTPVGYGESGETIASIESATTGDVDIGIDW
jgi:hypothetical protein